MRLSSDDRHCCVILDAAFLTVLLQSARGLVQKAESFLRWNAKQARYSVMLRDGPFLSVHGSPYFPEIVL
jgi:hypothetical protein